MSIKPEHLRNLINETLSIILPDMTSKDATELLMMTAAQESHCGRYLKQEGTGPALGIFQIEPATYRDLFHNFLRYNQRLLAHLEGYFRVHERNFELNLKGNLSYQIVIARLQYRRFPEALPSCDCSTSMAQYYKKYWNTKKGKATIAEALFNYDKYAK